MALRPVRSLVPDSTLDPPDAARWSSRARVLLEPAPAFLSTSATSEGDVYIGDASISFHPVPRAGASDGEGVVGLALHPSSIAVHALTTLPGSDNAAIYILVDDAPEDDGPDGTEMWISLPAGSQQSLTLAHEAISTVVRQHASPPSSRAEDAQTEDGAFDDAAGDSDPEPGLEEGTEQPALSAQGQRTLAHLESVLDWSGEPHADTTDSPSLLLNTTALSASASTLGVGAGLLAPTASSLPRQPTAFPPTTATVVSVVPDADTEGGTTADISEGALDDADEDEPQVASSWTEIRAETEAQGEIGVAPPVDTQSQSQSLGPGQAKTGTRPVPVPSPVLIFTGLPREFFEYPRLGKALLDLLNAYGELRRYVPLPAHGRAIVVYAAEGPATRAKEKLDRLLLPLEGDGSTPRPSDDTDGSGARVDAGAGARVARAAPGSTSTSTGGGLALRVYFGQRGDEQIWAPLPSKYSDESNHLLVPAAERNFLISPPGSPPIGWEPIVEDAPNRDTLADDLIAALGRLRDVGGIAFADNEHEHDPVPKGGADEAKQKQPRGSPTSTPPPADASDPDTAVDGSTGATSRDTIRGVDPPLGHAHPGGEPQLLIAPTGGMPGVQVSFALEDEENGVIPAAGAPTHSISSVKATVDAFYASHGHVGQHDGPQTTADAPSAQQPAGPVGGLIHRPPTPTPPMLQDLSTGAQRPCPTARPPVELRDRD